MKKVFIDEANNPSKPERRINTYTCPKGHITVTIDLEDGTTPMFLNCRQRNGVYQCDQNSVSAWYQCDQELTPEFEWYRPLPTDKLSKEEKEHCRQGGLLIRRIGEALATPKEAPSPGTTGRNEPCPCGATRKNSAGETVPKKFKSCCINNPLFKAV